VILLQLMFILKAVYLMEIEQIRVNYLSEGWVI